MLLLPRSIAAAACALVTVVACTSLPALAPGACGNGVVDPGEDCDGFANGAGKCRLPGTSGQCRYDCSDVNRTCPASYGCGTDSICRVGTAAFTSGAHVAAPGVLSIVHGDVDGDGRVDLVSETAVDIRVSFFDHPLALAQTTTLSVARSRVYVGPLDAPAPTSAQASGLVVTSSGGVDVWQGHPDRTVAPVVYPSFPVPGAKHVLIPTVINAKTALGTQMVILGSLGMQNGLFQVDQRGQTMPTILFTGTSAPEDIVSPPVVGHFVENQATLPCEQIILGFKGESAVHVFSPCHGDGSSNLLSLPGMPEPAQYLIPDVTLGGVGTLTGVLTALLNKDTHPDLLIGTTNGYYAAYGVGDGTFNSSATLPATGSGDGIAKAYALVVMGDTRKLATGFPLAAGDLTGDGFSDLVFGNVIVRASGNADGKYFLTGYAAPQTWSTAAIADLNGDGHEDILALSSTAIDFYKGTGTYTFDPTTYSTDSNIDRFAIGDVDGDSVNDVVLGEQALDENGELISGQDDLAVMFGRAAGGYPEDPTVLGQLPAMSQISVAPFEPSLVSPNINATGIGDIAAISDDPANPMQQLVAAFVGRADRELTSPFYLVDGKDQTKQSEVVTRFTTGHFTQTDHDDIAALGGDVNKYPITGGRFWLVPLTGNAVVSPASIEGSNLLPNTYDYGFGHLAAVDLTGGGFDVAIAVAPPASYSASDAGLFLIAGPSGVTKQTGLGVGDPNLPAWILRTGDVDANGTIDVGVFYSDVVSGKTAYKVRVLWNGHSGDLDPGNGADVPLPPGALLLSFALADIDGDPELEAILGTSTGVYFSKLDPAAKTFGAPTQLAGVAVGGHMQAADFDGDGVVDLAIGGTVGVDLYRGVPKID